MSSRLPHKRLGLIVGTNAVRDADGRLWLQPSNARVFDALRERVGEARICLPIVPQGDPKATFRLGFEPGEIATLPPLFSTREAQKHFFQVRRTIREFAKTVDALFIRMPFQVPRALLNLGQPKLLHIAGDPTEVVKVSGDYRGLWKLLATHYARHSNATMARLVKEPRTRTASNGRDMWDKLGCRDGRVVVSTCLYAREMEPRADFALGDPPRLLFVGYLRPEKGIHTLLDAFDRLRSTRPLKLTIAGGSDRVSLAEQQIRDRITNSKYAADIDLAGLFDFGPPLFDLYRNHDLCVLPSLSEGTPRTLVEARAFGCPVVATRVGGIPSSVEDGQDGLLVPPADAEALAAAIARVLDDESLRRRLIDEGLARAQRRTLETFVDELLDELEALFAGAPVAGAAARR